MLGMCGFAVMLGMADRTPNLRASYEAAATTPRRDDPPLDVSRFRRPAPPVPVRVPSPQGELF